MLGLLCAACTPTLGGTLKTQSYAELRPPSTLLAPGAIVAVISPSPLIVGIVCSAGESLGAAFSPMESPTATTEVKSKIEKSFTIDASYMNALKADAKYKSVKNIVLSVSNAKIFELSDAQVRANVVNRVTSCRDAIKDRATRKATLSMITSVVQADVVYRVEFETTGSLDASMKDDIVKDLSAQIGVSAGASGSNSMSGAGLFWGARDDQFLATIGSPPLPEQLRLFLKEPGGVDNRFLQAGVLVRATTCCF
jgi:hypothetical protein